MNNLQRILLSRYLWVDDNSTQCLFFGNIYTLIQDCPVKFDLSRLKETKNIDRGVAGKTNQKHT